MATSPEEVSLWMYDAIERDGHLDQATAADRIRQKFGKEFVYENENGNWAICRDVLAAFEKITGDSVVWERRGRTWRKRHSSDKPGRMQD